MVSIWLSSWWRTPFKKQNVNLGAMAVDGQNAFNAARRQAIMDQLNASFPRLAGFVETWYLDPSPLWFYLHDHSVFCKPLEFPTILRLFHLLPSLQLLTFCQRNLCNLLLVGIQMKGKTFSMFQYQWTNYHS